MCKLYIFVWPQFLNVSWLNISLVQIAGQQNGFNGDNGEVDEMEEFTRLYKEWKGLDDNFSNVPSLFTKVILTSKPFGWSGSRKSVLSIKLLKVYFLI